MKILLTGASGYLGSSIHKELGNRFDITPLSRTDLDLTDTFQVYKFFKQKYFDVIIHTAISGVKHIRENDICDLDNNIQMYYNLMQHANFGKFINIGSGAETHLQDTMYGLSKHIIRTSLLNKSTTYNLRVFSVFDEYDLSTRFIKKNIINYINKRPIHVFNNKRMDFFYMKDFIKLLEYYITSSSELQREIDCVYAEPKWLTDVAELINNQSSYKVEIEILSEEHKPDYIGVHSDVGITYDGLDKGIEVVYNKLLLNF